MNMQTTVGFAVICILLITAQGFSIGGPRGIPGGWFDVSVYHPSIQQAASFADAALGPFTRIVAKLRAQSQVR